MEQSKRLALEVAQLAGNEQLQFLDAWMALVRGNEYLVRKLKGRLAFHAILGGRKSLKPLEGWMESRLKKDFRTKPKQIAEELIKYKKIKRKYFPGLISAAQRVKARVHMRRLRGMPGWG